MKKLLTLIMIASMLLFASCAQKAISQADAEKASEQAKAEEKAKAEAAERAQREKEIQTVTESAKAAAGKDREIIAKAEAERLAAKSKFDDIHFDYDRYEILPADRNTLMSLSKWLIENKSQVLIEGHCDERGTNEYNLALGDRRANSAKEFLLATGVVKAKVETFSYGEEKPLCAEQSEECWGRNRRGHFVLSGTN